MKIFSISSLAKTAGLASGADAVYLFGSQATGHNHSDSDYGLALLLPDGCDQWQATRNAHRSLWPRSVPIDLVPITKRSWEDGRNTFIREVRKTGKLLYTKDG